jgi:hypothetical protein
MTTSNRSPLARKPTWDDTLVSFDLRRVSRESAGRAGRGATPTSRPGSGEQDTAPPGKLEAPHRAPRKSGFYSRVDPFAGIEQLDRDELDERDDDPTL